MKIKCKRCGIVMVGNMDFHDVERYSMLQCGVGEGNTHIFVGVVE